MTELENIVTSHLKNIQFPTPENKNIYSGYIDGSEEYDVFLTSLSAIGFSFSTRTSLNDSKSKGRIFFMKKAFTKSPHEISIPFFGSPFQVVRSVHLHCIRGERYFRPKPRSTDADNEDEDLPPLKRQRSAKATKKFGCPAFLSMKCIRVYNEPQYLLPRRQTHALSKVTELLHENLCKKSPPPTSILRFVIMLSSQDTHTHPISCTTVNFQLHPKLKSEIKQLVLENVIVVKDVKSRLADSVEKMFLKLKLPRPDPENKCFYPSDKMVRNHIQLALYDLKRSRFDEKDLEKCLAKWKEKYPEDKFFFRSYKSQHTDDNTEVTSTPFHNDGNQASVLFCHQSKWQRNLLKRYGNFISLLDPAFKTVKYGVPLYFIVVKTNCSYSIVGTFIIHEDTSILISEALSILVSWNPEWKPKYFLTDFIQSEVNAVKENFPNTAIYLCPFHRDMTWHRWLETEGHIPEGEDENIKRLWRDVATSVSEEEYKANLKLMKGNEMYKTCTLARTYFVQKWLSCREKWVMAYQAPEFLSIFNINNGREMHKKVLKHSFLRFSSNKTVPGLLRMLIDEFLPESIKNYTVSNVKIDTTATLSGHELPAFLHNKILAFVNHIKQESNKAVKEYNLDKIIDMSGSDTGKEGLYYVQSETEECYYIVDIQMGNCSCSHFTKWQFPCKHMCALFRFTDCTFDKLPSNYVNSPYITVDSHYSCGTVKIEGSISSFIKVEQPAQRQVTESLQLPVANNDGGFPLGDNDNSQTVPQQVTEHLQLPVPIVDNVGGLSLENIENSQPVPQQDTESLQLPMAVINHVSGFKLENINKSQPAPRQVTESLQLPAVNNAGGFPLENVGKSHTASQQVAESLQLPVPIVNTVSGFPLDNIDDKSMPAIGAPRSLVSDGSLPPVCADLQEAREKLKKLSGYSYLMDVTSNVAKQFCEKVNRLEAETLLTIKQFENVITLYPIMNSISDENSQQDSLLPSSYMHHSGNISNTAMFTAVPLVLSSSLQSALCDLDASLQDGEEMRTYVQM